MADLFDVVVARKLSGGGGGGLSGFSTTEVTLNITPPEGVTFVRETASSAISYPSTVYNNNRDYYCCPYLQVSNHKVTILLYNGVGYIDGLECYSEDETYWPLLSSATVSGDISWDENLGEGGAMVVAGNGTITISEYWT